MCCFFFFFWKLFVFSSLFIQPMSLKKIVFKYSEARQNGHFSTSTRRCCNVVTTLYERRIIVGKSFSLFSLNEFALQPCGVLLNSLIHSFIHSVEESYSPTIVVLLDYN